MVDAELIQWFIFSMLFFSEIARLMGMQIVFSTPEFIKKMYIQFCCWSYQLISIPYIYIQYAVP